MLTKDDLAKLRTIVREEVETETERIQNELQADIKMSEVRVLNELADIKTVASCILFQVSSIIKQGYELQALVIPSEEVNRGICLISNEVNVDPSTSVGMTRKGLG